MTRQRVLLTGILAVALTGGSWLFGQDSQTPARGRGSLPAGYSKLGLTDEQKQRIQTIRGEFRGRIELLQRQIKELQKQERTTMYSVLTDAQKARLKEIVASKAGGDNEEKHEKKTTEEKKVTTEKTERK